MYSPAYVWAKVLGHMEDRLTAPLVSTWFDDVEVVELTARQLVLYTPTAFRKDTIKNRFLDYIRDAMTELFQQNVDILVLDDTEIDVFRTQTKPNFIEFNPQFTFSSFVVGPSNRFAYSAALAVAANPANPSRQAISAYNPLFLYGPSGVGKTHLLYAIANQVHREHPDYSIIYIKGDQFTNELIRALQEGKSLEFHNKYRNADLFLVDDIQFIAGKVQTQEEFFHTFNALFESHRQIVVTSDRPPNDMLRLDDRIKTRFQGSMQADIQSPDYETRIAIIKNKAMTLGMDIPDEVCYYIAENITSNVRLIEGTVKRILAYRDLAGMPLDIANVTRAIKDMPDRMDNKVTPALIIGEVCRFYSIEEQVLRGTLKNKNTAEARQIAMYLVRKLVGLSLPEIGREFARDHTTVLHALRKVEKELALPDSGLANTIRDIEGNIDAKL